MLETFTLATFAGCVDDTFGVGHDAGTLDLRLVEVTRLGNPARPGGREPFSLVFHGPLEPVLAQQSRPVEHADLGAFELFLVPLGPDPAGEVMTYQAIFT